MDTSSRTTGSDGRILLTLALVVLSGITGAAFGMMFDGTAPAARLVLAAAAAVLVGALLERRHLALSLGAAVLGLLMTVGVVVFPRTLLFGMPTAETVGALARALGRVGRHAVEQTTPAQPLPSLFSASLIALWAASYASHALAARAGSAILAVIPPAGLLAFTSVVLEEGPHPTYAGAFLAAAIAVLFAARIGDLRIWGPVLPHRSRQSLRMAAGSIGRRARLLALMATAGALLLPGILPGFGSEALIDVHGRGKRVAISPLVDIRPNLQRRTAVELFRVEAERPSYWRLFALERFTGRLWVSDDDAEQDVVVEGRQALPSDPRTRAGRLLEQEFTISGLGGENLPAAFAPVGADVPVPTRYDTTLGTLAVGDGIPSGGFTYSVTSDVIAPIPEELDREFDLSSVPDRYMRLPKDLPPVVGRFAREITAGARSPYRKALAVQNYFRNFTYDDEFRAGHGVDDLLYFLEARRGYCEQFSAAMAVFLRSLGYPARVAVGFTPGIRDSSGRYRVTTDEAHAWTEMYFPGYGWLAFEPTPSRDNPAGASYQNLPIALPARGAPPVGEVARVQYGGRTTLQNSRLDFVERRLAGGGVGTDPEALDDAGGRGWVAPSLGAALLALLVLGGMPAVKTARRRRLLRRARSPRERVLAAFEVFERGAADLGLGRRDQETLDEYRARLRSAIRFSDGQLERLTGLAAVTLYSGRQPDREEAERALADARALAGDVRKEVGRVRVLTGAIRPYPPDDAGADQTVRLPPGPGGRPPAAPGRTGSGRSGTR